MADEDNNNQAVENNVDDNVKNDVEGGYDDYGASDDDIVDMDGQGGEGQWYSSWSSIQDTFNGTVSSTISTTRTELEGMIAADPSEWTTQQVVGLSIGVTVLFIIMLAVINCIRKCCCGGNSGRRVSSMLINDKDSKDGSGSSFQISKHPPRVIRKKVGGGMFSMSRAKYDSSSSTKLPVSVLLHGGHRLREKSMTGLGVKVAVIDSGIDKSHPGFHGQVKKQVWLRSGTPLTEDDHGTHVAGTIHFMAPDADLYDYRVFGETSKYGMDGDTAIARAIVQACEDGCNVINMSLRVSYPIIPAVKEAVEYAHSKGVIMVCAAGNDGDGQAMTNEMFAFPARWDETISVAACGKKRGLPVARFSESNPQVDFAAIGVDVISFKPRDEKTGEGDLFQIMQGTSMAAPHVTGLIAALMSHGKRYTPGQIRSLIAQKYVIDIGPPGRDNSTGLGFATFLSSRSELDALLAGKNFPGGPSSPSKGDAERNYDMMV
jgi:subtilisin family serine protease